MFFGLLVVPDGLLQALLCLSRVCHSQLMCFSLTVLRSSCQIARAQASSHGIIVIDKLFKHPVAQIVMAVSTFDGWISQCWVELLVLALHGKQLALLNAYMRCAVCRQGR